MPKTEITRVAVEGTRMVRSMASDMPDTRVTFEYSPESFTGTEAEFAVDICNAVIDAWSPAADNKMIINLPATVELYGPHVFADQIEWMSRNLAHRDKLVLSVHTHNDRGCAVAATELALAAGAERVEGTLFGNGERTGNADLVTIALNMYLDGIDPGLDLSDLPKVAATCERLTGLPTPLRQPYAGELVFTAFSGSHQDAINKGMLHSASNAAGAWEVPYLPIDPKDVGRTYDGIVRINSQSGKGGAAYIMREEHGFNLPKAMHVELGKVVQARTDACGTELLPAQIWECFYSEFVGIAAPLELVSTRADTSIASHQVNCQFDVRVDGQVREIRGHGNGPIDALKECLTRDLLLQFDVADYSQHALGGGANAEAVSYIAVSTNGGTFYGVGIDSNITVSGLKALVSAVNRAVTRCGKALVLTGSSLEGFNAAAKGPTL